MASSNLTLSIGFNLADALEALAAEALTAANAVRAGQPEPVPEWYRADCTCASCREVRDGGAA